MQYVRNNVGYFIAYKDLFSTWLTMGKDFDVSNVTDALSAFSRLINPNYKKVFDKIFETLETGLSKLGDSAASRTKTISDLIYLTKDIPINVKVDSAEIKEILSVGGYYPAFHMNKKRWVSIILDDTLSDEKIQ